MSGKILITGASGFLGYHLINEAKKISLEIHAAIRNSSKVEHLIGLADKFVELPYRHVEHLAAILEKEQYDYIVHAAALTRAKDDRAYELVNVQYSENLALAAVASGIPLKSFVFVSSLAAIGPIAFGSDAYIDEHTVTNPVTAYGRSKRQAEEKLLKIERLPLTIIRPTAIYGPRERDLLVLFKSIARGLDAYIGKEPQRLTFVHGEDVATAILKAALHKSGSKQQKTYNITDGHVYNRYEVAKIVQEITQKKGVRLHLPLPVVKAAASLLEFSYRWSSKTPVLYAERIKELTASNWACDISAAKHCLQYKPKFDLATGLKQTMAWYKEQKWITY